MDALLDQSQAMPEFKEAVHAMLRGENQEQISFNWGAPPVKVLRVVAKILETMPEVQIEKVDIHATSGCSTFIGSATIQPGKIQVQFNWDCQWRASQMGWNNFFGEPDQIRAAHEFGYQCFKQWDVAGEGKAAPAREKVHGARRG